MTLSDRYSRLQSQIHLFAEKSGRDSSSIHLVAVTKYATIDQMKQAYDLGIRHFGESRLQTALPKIAELPNDIIWHFIGSLQSNKVAKIVEHFDYIHSVDSIEIAKHIAKHQKKRPHLFVQVNTSKEATKHGFLEQELIQQFDALLQLDLNLIGLMTMAPMNKDLESIRDCFKQLRLLRDRLSLKFPLPHLSMGMTQDFQIAIEEGATFLRIGSLLFD